MWWRPALFSGVRPFFPLTPTSPRAKQSQLLSGVGVRRVLLLRFDGHWLTEASCGEGQTSGDSCDTSGDDGSRCVRATPGDRQLHKRQPGEHPSRGRQDLETHCDRGYGVIQSIWTEVIQSTYKVYIHVYLLCSGNVEHLVPSVTRATKLP